MKVLNLDFMGYRKIAAVFSISTTIFALLLLIFKGFAWGLDFTGGTLVEVAYEKPIEVKAIRDVLSDTVFKDAMVQPFGSGRDVLLRLAPNPHQNSHQQSADLFKVLKTHRADVSLRRVEFVGPQVGEELAEQGFMAMLVAVGCILIYVALRFDFRFASGAVIALAHDVILTVGLVSLLDIEFDLTILAAILAIIGYSLNDTIVVYDRIRENFRRMRKASSEEVINASLNQTLKRTLMTSVSVILTLLALYYLGGETLRGFSMTLLIGVILGTYSSIYVASALALFLGIAKQHLVSSIKPEGGSQASMV